MFKRVKRFNFTEVSRIVALFSQTHCKVFHASLDNFLFLIFFWMADKKKLLFYLKFRAVPLFKKQLALCNH